MSVDERFEKFVSRFGTFSCPAKWAHALVILYQRRTHSCMHPRSHPIPLEDIEENPAALHNTEYKRRVRRVMLEGGKPSECNYCWSVEDSGGFSDRKWASTAYEKYVDDYLSKLTDQELLSGDIVPWQLEVAFSPTCNLKCVYCSPEHSSSWASEIRNHGPIPLSSDNGVFRMHDLDDMRKAGTLPVRMQDDDPYLEAFHRWWDDIGHQIGIVRVTGGEPLLSDDTFRLMNSMISRKGDQEFHVNSSLMVPDKIWDRFVSYLVDLRKSGKRVTIYVSLESTGALAEYIRYGLDYELFMKRVHEILDTGVSVSFSTTNTVLSLPDLGNFYKEVVSIRRKYASDGETYGRVWLSLPHIKYPDFLQVSLWDNEMVERFFEPAMNLVEDELVRTNRSGWMVREKNLFDSLKRVAMQDISPERKDFLKRRLKEYLEVLDSRRGVNHRDVISHELPYV